MSAPPTNVAGVQKIDPVRTRTGWIMLWYFSPSSPVFLSQNETRKQRMKSLTLLYTTDKLPLISTCGLSHMENRLFYVHFWILITAPPLYTHGSGLRAAGNIQPRVAITSSGHSRGKHARDVVEARLPSLRPYNDEFFDFENSAEGFICLLQVSVKAKQFEVSTLHAEVLNYQFDDQV